MFKMWVIPMVTSILLGATLIWYLSVRPQAENSTVVPTSTPTEVISTFQLTAFFKLDTDEAEVQSVINSIKAADGIINTNYISQAEASSEFSEEPTIHASDSATPTIQLPASIEITVEDRDSYIATEALLRGYPSVEKVVDGSF